MNAFYNTLKLDIGNEIDICSNKVFKFYIIQDKKMLNLTSLDKDYLKKFNLGTLIILECIDEKYADHVMRAVLKNKFSILFRKYVDELQLEKLISYSRKVDVVKTKSEYKSNNKLKIKKLVLVLNGIWTGLYGRIIFRDEKYAVLLLNIWYKDIYWTFDIKDLKILASKK